MALLLNTGNTVSRSYTIIKPSPTHPIQPQECGDRTENLFDGQLQQGYYTYHNGVYVLSDAYVCTHLIPCIENTTYTFRCINTGGGSKNYGYAFFDSSQNRIGDDYINAFTEGDVVTHTATTPQNTAFLAINIAYGRRQANVIRPSDITDFMLNSGSTALPYEPYGYKIPISSGQQTTNIYLGSTQTVRQIKKYTITGNETIFSCVATTDGQNYCVAYRFMDFGMTDIKDFDKIMQDIDYPIFISSHFVEKTNTNSDFNDIQPNQVGANTVSDAGNRYIIFCVSGLTTAADYSAWFAQQYTNGTPVEVYYILETPTTGIVNEPIRKIGDYADTVSGITIPTIAGANSFDVLTTLKPSEVTANYHGWHTGAVHERDSGQWD